MEFVERVLDAVDVETVLKCNTEDEARRMVIEWLKSLGFSDVDVVYAECSAAGARVRARAYLYRPGDRYPWLEAGRARAQAVAAGEAGGGSGV